MLADRPMRRLAAKCRDDSAVRPMRRALGGAHPDVGTDDACGRHPDAVTTDATDHGDGPELPLDPSFCPDRELVLPDAFRLEPIGEVAYERGERERPADSLRRPT